ncbi:hypothetical protein Pcinc_020855 [Petrolisthes cinctipes]|uniref:Ig-like domain-containing protein n=1 Tax=Petrolisthes cinctipes TaxID=88211 RepID=A0AAE1FH48_PETCI|nr:hypothetical protein Pcinc_020855 [Petrolisthes cinctipes]
MICLDSDVPFCAGDRQEQTLGAARGSTAAVRCRVEAHPSHDLTWTWIRKKVDGSEEELPQENVRNDGVSSSVLVTPHTPEEYGRFLCLATNSVGRQEAACVVNLVPAGPPDTPTNCSVTQGKPKEHLDTASLSITCLEGFDGGLPQQFQLEARQDGELVSNITSEFPEWVVSGLRAGVRVILKVTAHNARGRSEPLNLEEHTTSAQRSAAAPDTESVATLPPILAAALGLVALLLLLLVVALIICRRMKPRPRKPRAAEVPLAPITGGDNFDDPDVVASIQRQPPNIDVIPFDQDPDQDDNDDAISYDPELLEESHVAMQACVYVHRGRDTHSAECEEGEGGLCSCGGVGVGSGGGGGGGGQRRSRREGQHHQAPLVDNTDREDVAINDSQSNDSGVSESESESELREMVPEGQMRSTIFRKHHDTGTTYLTLASGETLGLPSDTPLRLIPSEYSGTTPCYSVNTGSRDPSPVEVHLKPFVSKEYRVSPDAVEEVLLLPSSCRELRLLPTTTGDTQSTRSSMADVRSPSSREQHSGKSSCVSSLPTSSCIVKSPSSQREVICLPISPGESPRPHLAPKRRSRDLTRDTSNPVPSAQPSKHIRPLSSKDQHYVSASGEPHLQQQQGEMGRSVTLLQGEHGQILFVPNRTTQVSEGVRGGRHRTQVFPGIKVSDSSQGEQPTPPLPPHPLTLPKAAARESKARRTRGQTKDKVSDDPKRVLPSTPLLPTQEMVKPVQKHHIYHPHPDPCRRESSV